MIYLDTSVVLAQVFDETIAPPAALWREALISSRLLVYEFWSRVHARRLPPPQMDEARALLAAISFVELTPPVDLADEAAHVDRIEAFIHFDRPTLALIEVDQREQHIELVTLLRSLRCTPAGVDLGERSAVLFVCTNWPNIHHMFPQN